MADPVLTYTTKSAAPMGILAAGKIAGVALKTVADEKGSTARASDDVSDPLPVPLSRTAGQQRAGSFNVNNQRPRIVCSGGGRAHPCTRGAARAASR